MSENLISIPDAVSKEIIEISLEYRRQVKEKGYFDTPGGIENTQDAFDYINAWADMIAAAPKGETK